MSTPFDGVAAEEIAHAQPVLELIDAATTEPKVGHECYVCEWSPDQSLLAWSCGRLVKVVAWHRFASGSESFESLSNSAVIINVGQYVLSAAFSARPTSRQQVSAAAAATADGTREIISGSSSFGTISRASSGVSDSNNNIRYHFHRPDDLVLALGLQNGRIRTYCPATGKLQLELMDHTDAVRGLRFAPGGSMVLASASRDGRLKFWNLKDDGNMFLTLDTSAAGHRHALYACAWSPCGRALASVGAVKHVTVWDMGLRQPVCRLIGHHHDVVSCQFSADGILLATCSLDTTAIVWDYKRGEKICVLGHLFPMPSPIFAGGANEAYVRSIALGPDGLHAVTVSDDRHLRFWDLSSPRCPVSVGHLPAGTPLCCGYSPMGDVVAVGNSNGDLVFFLSTASRLPTLSQLCRRVVRQSLSYSSGDALEKLNLPFRLKNYLKFVTV